MAQTLMGAPGESIPAAKTRSKPGHRRDRLFSRLSSSIEAGTFRPSSRARHPRLFFPTAPRFRPPALRLAVPLLAVLTLLSSQLLAGFTVYTTRVAWEAAVMNVMNDNLDSFVGGDHDLRNGGTCLGPVVLGDYTFSSTTPCVGGKASIIHTTGGVDGSPHLHQNGTNSGGSTDINVAINQTVGGIGFDYMCASIRWKVSLTGNTGFRQENLNCTGTGFFGIVDDQGGITSYRLFSSPSPNFSTLDVDNLSHGTVAPSDADLVISKTDSADPVIAGNNLTYTVTVMNNGPADADDVVVTDTLPAGVTLVSTSGCAEDPSGVATCTLGTITASSSDQYTITVTVDSDTTGVLTNTAAVASSTTLTSTGDDSVMETTTVSTSADLVITKTDSVDPVIAGNNVTYTVTVMNNGPSDALAVVVTDTLPSGVTLVSTSGCAEDPAGVATCTLGTIAASSSDQYTITVTVDSDTTGVLTNTAAVASSTTLRHLFIINYTVQ